MSTRTKKSKKNMYKGSKRSWNPYAGCGFECNYCKPTFQAQSKRQKHRCKKCYDFEPHVHEKRLENSLPRTGDGEFITVGLSGDVSFCPTGFLKKVADKIKQYPDRTFLIQSKNPRTFNRIEFPENVILGITLETDRGDFYRNISKAPLPRQRAKDFAATDHPRKFVTVEPVMQFNQDRLLKMILKINPEVVWIGFDSRKCNLPEPEPEEVQELIGVLQSHGVEVRTKTMR